MGLRSGCYKTRKDRKPIALQLASKIYHECGSLASVARVFNVHHTQLRKRFIYYGIPLKSKSEALFGKKKTGSTGKKHHNWKGGYSVDTKGYLINNGTKKRLHREKAEKILGRKLNRYEVVHHVNGDKLNNENNNLVICSKSYHQWLHAKMCNGKIGINHFREVQKK